MFEQLALLLVSALVLAKAAETVVDNAVILAKFLKVSEMAIGFLLVSVATSLPELSIAITSIFEKAPGISAGNVLGANIADVTLVLGVAALVSAIKISKNDAWKATNILGLAALAPFLLIFFPSLISTLVLFAVFVSYAVISVRQKSKKTGDGITRQNATFALFFFAVGVAFLLVSADFVVKSAVSLASILGLSSTIIGATIISIGTTLPELSVSLQSVRKNSSSLALGNAVGSTLVNSTLVLGVASLSPLFSLNVFFTMLAVLFLAVAAVVSRLLHTRHLTKPTAWFFVSLFALSMALAIAFDLVL